MNIRIYFSKKNPDVLKAERFFKERRVPFVSVDLKKQKIGPRELKLFAQKSGAAALVDRSSPKALERPVAHYTGDDLILSALQEDPAALVSPIVRNENKVTVGVDEEEWAKWIAAK